MGVGEGEGVGEGVGVGVGEGVGKGEGEEGWELVGMEKRCGINNKPQYNNY